MFCFPHDLKLNTAPDIPKFHFFGCTLANGTRYGICMICFAWFHHLFCRLYGCCLRFDETVDPNRLRDLKRRLREEKVAHEAQLLEQERQRIEAEEKKKQQKEEELKQKKLKAKLRYLADEAKRLGSPPASPTVTREDSSIGNLSVQIDYSRENSVSRTGNDEDTIVTRPMSKSMESTNSPATDQPSKPSDASVHAEPGKNVDDSGNTKSISDPAAVDNNAPARSEAVPAETKAEPIAESAAAPSGPVFLPEDDEPRTIYCAKCICILSQHAFMQEYRTVLTEIFRLTTMREVLPIEKTISNFMLEVPYPPAGRIKVHYKINNKNVFFSRSPANNPLQLSHFRYGVLFQVQYISF